ncbi:MAG TPA: PIG-L family deacetylase [Anaerolineales bacterium]|nr:PIG-L family deacetylase [Anaerolineales bacterium]
MRWIYLSPHLDDAVLSAGGFIYEQTKSSTPVEIWTFMAGYPTDNEYSPFAEFLHQQWGFSSAEETIQSRREEDRNAVSLVGATTVHFDFLDCIYRRNEKGEWPYYEIYLPPQEMDADLPQQIADAITPRLKPDDVLVCQLSVGSHVDHVLVRQAAELLGRPLLYDIDVPYIFYKPEELASKSVGMKENAHTVSVAGLKAWQEAVLAYKSQLPVLGEAMSTPEDARESIQSYWGERKGIHLFQRM